MEKEKINQLEKISIRMTEWVGTTTSLVVHTILFIFAFTLAYLGFDLEKILLFVTTIVSLEAIYLSIFIQMTVNRSTQSLEEVEKDIDEIQENVEELGTDIGEIQEDVEELGTDIDEISEDIGEIQEDVEEIQEDADEDDKHEEHTKMTLSKIETRLQQIVDDIKTLKE